MAMLEHTHLYGRHLVLDYAKEDEGLEEIREKTKTLFDASQPMTPEQANKKKEREKQQQQGATNNNNNNNNNNSNNSNSRNRVDQKQSK
jgi:hypothetical protein